MTGRTPPAVVLRALREEVGFHCPADVDGDICGNPYLTWHHFDPPWRIENHHRPDGMIALCRAHADKADHGSYTDDQLRRFKSEGKGRGQSVSGRFEWMRRDLLGIVGGNAYYRTPVLVELFGKPAVWFNRNEHDELLLNFDMPSEAGGSRASIRDNGWTVSPQGVSELICPPSGRKLKISYENGDLLDLEFRSVSVASELSHHFPFVPSLSQQNFTYPLTVVTLAQIVAGSPLQLMPNATLVGTNSMRGCLVSDCGVGLSLGGRPGPAEASGAVAEVLRLARGLPGYTG